MIVPNQRNLKVHFASSEALAHYVILKKLGLKYNLYTAYPFVSDMIKRNPQKLTKRELEILQTLTKGMNHTIQDSGLFTLMFGAKKGKKDKKMISNWYDALIDFTKQHNNGATVVEVDCQKVLGPKEAWVFRERMKKDLPNNRQINVFHIEDGQKGLDRLIEFSDYIALSIPELRFAGKKNHVITLANYIKSKKPEIDIHLLGCTEKRLLQKLKFCTSSDSTSYLSGVRYGFIEQRHISRIKPEKVKQLVGEKTYNSILKTYKNANNLNGIILDIYNERQKYIKYAGNQE